LAARFGSLLGAGRSSGKFRILVLFIAFLLSAAAFVGFGSFSRYAGLDGFEIGKVAERDINAEAEIVYVDEHATSVRAEAERRLVPAVFVIDEALTNRAVEAFLSFKAGFLDLYATYGSREELLARLTSKFPDLAASGILARLVDYPVPSTILTQAEGLLRTVLGAGVIAIPDQGLEAYNPELLEIRRWDNGPLVYEQLALDRAVTRRTARRILEEEAQSLKLSTNLVARSVELAAAFVVENAFFDESQSSKRAEAVGARVEPVVRRIAKGEPVIRKGFIVTPAEFERLDVLRKSGLSFDSAAAASGVALILALFLGAAFILAGPAVNRHLDTPSFMFVVALGLTYLVGASLLSAVIPGGSPGTIAVFLPTALFAMVITILYGERFSLLYMTLLVLGFMIVSGFDALSAFHAFVSGVAAVLLVRRTEKRIDLIRAGAQLGLIQFAAVFAVYIFVGKDFMAALGGGAWSAVNGFMCGVLTLGFLPVLESALNAPTVFRLQELSDLNAPALKRLLSVAPGTYSHSVTVAHLAESACREIGADALLARVGAYYHDIGKIEQPEYFIENQSGYNKHDDINPRLSATVLRGHVKFGMERAEALGLPETVKDIIAQHHGTSLISYFFNQAQKDAPETSSDDYCYPGPLPSTREAAVVMLADSVEAASRTLKKPTITRLEQFVRDLVMDKFGHDQLSASELSFHDLDIIMNTFVRILAGHFHSRIEYPKIREGAR
jgi:putative nucleotidyltransferase with HDIG domain